MTITDIEMYEMLREKMDHKEAKTLVEYIESRVDHRFEHAREVFPGKDDIFRLELKIAETHIKIAESKDSTSKKIAESKDETNKIIAEGREETNKKIAEGREETNKKFAEVNLKIAELKEETNKKFAEVNLKIAETHIKIAESKNDLIKWLFGLILGSTVAIIGVMLTVFKMI